MNRHTNTTAQPGKTECCPDSKCEAGLRNNYFEGKRLTADSFQVEQKYLNDRRHLLNRAIHGWGVVYGYGIIPTGDDGCSEPGMKITAGLALDQCGRELLQNGGEIKLGDQLIVLDDEFKRIDYPAAFSNVRRTDCWLLKAHYAEQKTTPVKVEDQCRCEHHEWDHVCETVRYSLQRIDCSKCCRDVECGLKCECGPGRCCEESFNPDDSTKQNYGNRQDYGNDSAPPEQTDE